jgi:hypothetical protein
MGGQKGYGGVMGWSDVYVIYVPLIVMFIDICVYVSLCVCSPCVLREEELVSVNLWCSLVSQTADMGLYII